MLDALNDDILPNPNWSISAWNRSFRSVAFARDRACSRSSGDGKSEGLTSATHKGYILQKPLLPFDQVAPTSNQSHGRSIETGVTIAITACATDNFCSISASQSEPALMAPGEEVQ
jgi:hypothetical protein